MNEETLKAVDRAFKALEEREELLDKIKAEINRNYCCVENDYDQGFNFGLYTAFQIIEKYKE